MNRTIFKEVRNHNLFRTPLAACLTTWGTLAITFNSRSERITPNSTKQSSGLFTVPELDTHEGFYLLKAQCVADTERLVQEALSVNRSRKMVEVFDELSDSLCRGADMAEFIRVAHTSTFYTQAAEVASATICGAVEKLNTNSALYNALLEVVKKGDKMPTKEVDDLVGELFLFDFEQSGIHLPEIERDKVVGLNNYLLQIGKHFATGSTTPRVIKKRLLPDSTKNNFAGDGDQVIVSDMCNDSANPITREVAYRIYLQHNERQDYLLTELLKRRHELAQICGFSTYAHRTLRESTIEKPEMVMAFLNSLSDGIKNRVSEDLHTMNEMKQEEHHFCGPLAMWDTAYYTKKAKKRLFNIQCSEYAPYFSLGTCMEGLSHLLVKLYGISLIITDMLPGECWADDVYKLMVTHEDEGLLGYIYCDFYQRKNKPDQESHFTIQGGRTLPNGSYQHPIVVLMLNLPLPVWSNPTLLSPSMVDNLFHEMGHAMHSMLARTQYQHIAGTRCSTDFAEVPSVLMEYFASDPRILKTFARHFQTKEPIPEDMLERLCASKHVFAASETQTQLFYSGLDQLYHGIHPLMGSTTDVLAKAQARYYSLPYVEGTSWQLRFGHLVGYGAKYYSYLMSRALASCIWQSYFEEDPLNRTQGERYRRELLAYGGGKPSRQLVAEFLQKEPTTDLLVDSLLKDIDNKQALVHRVSSKLCK